LANSLHFTDNVKIATLSEQEDRPTQRVKVSGRNGLPSLDSDRYMTKKEAATYTGLSVRTLDSARDLRRYKPGGKVLFKKSEIDAWITQSRVQRIDLDSISKKAKLAIDALLKAG
jgi:excisionase family DNA binding protein